PSDGLVAKSDEGQYVFTTASGCATVLNLNVSGSCDPGDAPVSAEWKIGAEPYQNGPQGQDVSITADEGQTVRLSLLPNLIPNTNTNLRFSLTSPNGSKFENILGDYLIQSISPTQQGTYLLESSQGCSVIIDITVNTFDCSTVETEYRINGTGQYFTGESAVTIEQGNNLLLSIIPNGIAYSISGPNGNDKAMNTNDLTLSSLSSADSGTYIFTTEDDCTRTISLSVTGDTPTQLECDDVEVRYSLDGGAVMVGDSVTMDEGGDILIMAGPSGVGYSVLSPEGATLAGNSEDGYSIDGITKSQEGLYTIVTELAGPPGSGVQEATLEYVDSEEVSGEDGRALNALDGNPSTIWHTKWSGGNDPQPHEIRLDLGTSSIVDGLSYLPRQDGGINGTIGRYEIYVSGNTSDWGDAVSSGTWANNTNLKTVGFTGKQGRYVRLVSFSDVNGNAWTSAAEISVNTAAIICNKSIEINLNQVDDGLLKINGIGLEVTSYDPSTQDSGLHEVEDGG
ncbi:F5/8 type C domain-containing protein, partial [Maribacter sedimenticola]